MTAIIVDVSAHQAELRQFRDAILAELDNASVASGAKGLNAPMGMAQHRLSCEWATRHALPELLSRYLDFAADTAVRLAVYYENFIDMAVARVTATSVVDKDRRVSIAVIFDDDHEQSGFSVMVGPHMTFEDDIVIYDYEFREMIDQLFAGIEQYAASASSLNLESAVQLGIMMRGVGFATCDTATRKAGELSVTVKCLNRSHPNGQNSHLIIELMDEFTGADFGTFDGFVIYELELVSDPDGEVVSATRHSAVELEDEPVFADSDDSDHIMMSYVHEALPGSLPAALQAKLYADDRPTLADLSHYLQLVTG